MARPDRSSHSITLQFFIAGALAVAAMSALGFALSDRRIAASTIAAAPIETIPTGYRDWMLISVAAVGSPLNDLRAKLGNDIAIGDLQHGTLPYRDGAIIARLAWRRAHDTLTDAAFRLQGQQVGLSAQAIAKLLSGSAVAGTPTNVQFMIKDSKRYAATGGWGFAQFTNGKPDTIVQTTCFACHAPAKERDFVFTRYSN